MHFSKNFFTYLLIIMCLACSKKNTSPQSTLSQEISILKSYANINLNQETTYEVEHINYNPISQSSDTSTYYIKTLYTDTFTDLSEGMTYKKERYKKDNPNQDWVIKDVWTAKLYNLQFHQTEEDVKIIKLVAPISFSTTWDGNIFNQNSKAFFRYTAIHQKEQLKYHLLDSVTTVVQEDDKNQSLFSRNFSEEKYATNIGLVYKKYINAKKKFNPSTQTYEISEGDEITYHLLTY